MLYYVEVSETLQTGDQRGGYIKDISEDGKLVVTLKKSDLKIRPKEAPCVDTPEKSQAKNLYDQKKQILQALKNAHGFLPLHDKSSPDEIYKMFQMSKKTFKYIIAGFYRERKIAITKTGIRLLQKKTYPRDALIFHQVPDDCDKFPQFQGFTQNFIGTQFTRHIKVLTATDGPTA